MVKYNEELSKHCTFHIGGICEKYYIPETVDELKEILSIEPEHLIISGGSNLLINDKRRFPCVIDMSKVCTDFVKLNDNSVFVGASLRIQKVIKLLQQENLGGFEFLYSLPALFGGIVYMNAGRGSDGKCIGDFIAEVKCIDQSGQIIMLKAEECGFQHRKSKFMDNNLIILGATINCNSICKTDSEKLVNERIEFCKNRQDTSGYNAGSAFSECNGTIMRFVQKYPFLFSPHKNASFSRKTFNWINNSGKATYRDILSCIKKVTFIHRILGKKIRVEYRIWK